MILDGILPHASANSDVHLTVEPVLWTTYFHPNEQKLPYLLSKLWISKYTSSVQPGSVSVSIAINSDIAGVYDCSNHNFHHCKADVILSESCGVYIDVLLGHGTVTFAPGCYSYRNLLHFIDWLDHQQHQVQRKRTKYQRKNQIRLCFQTPRPVIALYVQ